MRRVYSLGGRGFQGFTCCSVILLSAKVSLFHLAIVGQTELFDNTTTFIQNSFVAW